MSEPKYHKQHVFQKNTKAFMKKLVYLGPSILGISKSPMYIFWHYYTKLEHGKKAQLYYIDIDSFTVHIKNTAFT